MERDVIKELEKAIYDRYYELGGEDARMELWKAVIEAKKAADPASALDELYESVEDYVY